MRGIGPTLSCLPAARAFIAGAAILAGAVPGARAQPVSEEVAMALPWAGPLSPRGFGGGVDLPRPLPPSVAQQVRRVFALQAQGAMAEAAELVAEFDDRTLDGHILADRYLGRFGTASNQDLARWLARYADHPDAPAVHAALLARLPPGAAAPAKPALDGWAADGVHLARNPALDRTVMDAARAGRADAALRMLWRTRPIEPLYAGQLGAEIARAVFTQGRDAEALSIARGAVRQSGGQAGLAGYVGGLAAWRMGHADLALPLFEQAAGARLATQAVRAGAAFWAARGHLRHGDAAGSLAWSRRAAGHPNEFYGLLARRALDGDSGSVPGRETLGPADTDALLASPQGLRAFALLQVGQRARAEAELRLLAAAAPQDRALCGSILRVAEDAGLTGLTATLAGRLDDGAANPLPALRPAGGFRVDPAMVYALARVESNFDAQAVSGAGARGLMQIMPLTATYIGGGPAIARRLRDPATNLSVGQSYLLYLAAHGLVGGDLIRLLGSYNAGPASFARMVSTIPPTDDPLLFLESIPNDETRAFIPRALAYTWVYAARLGVAAPSLDALSTGAWPAFRAPPQDEAPVWLH